MHDVVSRWGWRAYAIPVLAVVTVVALATSVSDGSAPGGSKGTRSTQRHPLAASVPTGTPPASAPSRIALSSDDPGGAADAAMPKGYALPAGAAYTARGDGTFRTLAGTSPVVGTGGRLFRYSIDVEDGVRDVDLDQFQALVVRTLSDPRSWSGHGVRLQRVDSGHVDFHVTMTVRTLCGYTIRVETSCYAPASAGTTKVNRVVFDDARWVRGATAKGVPIGAHGAPGAEQQDTDTNNEYYIGD